MKQKKTHFLIVENIRNILYAFVALGMYAQCLSVCQCVWLYTKRPMRSFKVVK